MKNLLKFIAIMTFSIMSLYTNAQDIDTIYPKYMSDSTGDYVILTVEQARSIDNDLELLYYIQGVIESNDNRDEVCVKVIDKLKQEREVLRLKISKLEEVDKKKDEKILKLNHKITELSLKGELYEDELNNFDEIIAEKDKIIKKQKRQKVIAFGVAIIITVLSILK